MLTPFLSRSEDWKIQTLRLVSVPVHDSLPAAAWVEKVAPTLPADSLKSQYELAYAWYTVANHFGDPAFLAKSRDVVMPLTSAP